MNTTTPPRPIPSAAPSPTRVLDHLDAEWSRLGVDRRNVALLRGWRLSDPRFGAHHTPDDLVAAIRTESPQLSTLRCHALLGQVEASPFASRCLLQTMIPGLGGIVKSWIGQVERDPSIADRVAAYRLDVEVVSAAHVAIREWAGTEREYPIRRMLVRARQLSKYRLDRETRHHDVSAPFEVDVAATPSADASASSERLLGVLSDAVEVGVLSKAEAKLIAESRCLDRPICDLAAEFGMSERTLRRHRMTAERTLIESAPALRAA